MSFAQIPALGIMCSHLVMTSELLTVITFHSLFCTSSTVAQFNLFLVSRIFYLSNLDKCQIGDLLSESKYNFVLGSLAAQVHSTEILIVIRIAKSTTQYWFCTTWRSQQRKNEPHSAKSLSGKNRVHTFRWSGRNGRCRQNWLFLRRRTLH